VESVERRDAENQHDPIVSVVLVVQKNFQRDSEAHAPSRVNGRATVLPEAGTFVEVVVGIEEREREEGSWSE